MYRYSVTEFGKKKTLLFCDMLSNNKILSNCRGAMLTEFELIIIVLLYAI